MRCCDAVLVFYGDVFVFCGMQYALCVMRFCCFRSEVETAEACRNIMCIMWLCTDGGVVDNEWLLMDNYGFM